MGIVDRLTTRPPPEQAYRALVRLRRGLRWVRDAVVPADAVLVERTLAAVEVRALGIAAERDLGRALADGPSTTAQVAARIELAPDATERLLRLLWAAGVVRRTRDGRWDRTRLGAALDGRRQRSARDWVRQFGGREHLRLLAELDAAVEGRGSAPVVVHGVPFFEWTARAPAAGQRFDAAMADGSRLTGPMIAARVDWSSDRVVCDVGGGTGRVLAEVLAAHPHLHGILFDLPSVVADAGPFDAGVSDRVEVVGGDFLDTLPTADTHLLVAILHDWGDDDAARILERCAAALRPGGRVVVVDQLLDAERPPFLEYHADMLMLLLTEGGRERSADEIARLAAPAGLRPGRTWDLLNLRALELRR